MFKRLANHGGSCDESRHSSCHSVNLPSTQSRNQNTPSYLPSYKIKCPKSEKEVLSASSFPESSISRNWIWGETVELRLWNLWSLKGPFSCEWMKVEFELGPLCEIQSNSYIVSFVFPSSLESVCSLPLESTVRHFMSFH